MKNLLYKMAMIVMVAAVFTGCDRDLEIPFTGSTPPSLTIEVQDAAGNAVSGATVDLYNSLDGYVTETGSLATGTTDGAGSVNFTEAQLGDRGVFYFNVASGTLRNWTSTVSTKFLLLNDGETTVSTVAGEVPSEFIALTANTWVFGEYLYPATTSAPILPIRNVLPACEQDDVLTFLKDGTLLRAEGATACASVSDHQGPISAAGAAWSKWAVTDGGAMVSIRDLDPTFETAACPGPAASASDCPSAALAVTATTVTIDYGGGYVATLTAN